MFKTIITALIFSFFTLPAFSKGVFQVAPYLIMAQKKEAFLRFQPVDNLRLDISIRKESSRGVESNDYSQVFLNNKLHEIPLGRMGCETSLRYTITQREKNVSEVLDHSVYPMNCSGQGPFYFGFMSDTQIKNNAGQLRAVKLAESIEKWQQKIPFSLVVNAGDLVQFGSIEKEWVHFFDVGQNYLKRSYIIAAVGNHEYYEAKRRALPRRPFFDLGRSLGQLLRRSCQAIGRHLSLPFGENCPKASRQFHGSSLLRPTYVYKDRAPALFMKYMRSEKSSDLGNLAIHFGSTQLLILNSNFKQLSNKKIQSQWSWLKSKLDQSEALGQVSIIVMHHSPFSSSLEHQRAIPKRLRKEFVPLIEKYSSVKFVLSGHLHMYERSLKNNIHYIISGPSGGIHNYISYPNKYKKFIKPLTTTFSIFKITSEQISVKTYGPQQRIIDQVELKLRD